MNTKHVPTKNTSSQPSWFNMHGDKISVMQPGPFTGQGDLILMSGVIARIQINRIGRTLRYTLDWLVQHSGGFAGPRTGGLIELSALALSAAFNLKDGIRNDGSVWLIEQYGGTVASQGKFIRWGNYLNIPGPGTGHDGDANISVYLSDEIKNAVRSMLEAHAAIKA